MNSSFRGDVGGRVRSDVRRGVGGGSVGRRGKSRKIG